MDDLLAKRYIAVLDDVEHLSRQLEKNEQWQLMKEAEAIKSSFVQILKEIIDKWK